MSRKPLPVLQDMPYHIKRMIAGHLDLYDKMFLRASHLEFRQLIGHPEMRFAALEVSFLGEEATIVDFVSPNLQLRHTFGMVMMGCKCEKIIEKPGISVETSKYYWKSDHAEIAIQTFRTLVDTANFSVRKFTLAGGPGDDMKKFIECLRSLPGPLKVESLDLRYSEDHEDVAQVLKHLDSEVLKNLDLCIQKTYGGFENIKAKFSEICRLEQWKKLQELELCRTLTSLIPAECLLNIPESHLSLSPADHQKLPDFVEIFCKSPLFRRCKIRTKIEGSQIFGTIWKDLQFETINSVKIALYPEEKPILKISVNEEIAKILIERIEQ